MNLRPGSRAVLAAWIVVLYLLGGHTASAKVIFVDNLNGFDGNDGLAASNQSLLTGPVQTLYRALKLVRRGDGIVLKNTGVPYQESLTLSGARHSGYPTEPFTIDGNGAVLSGLATVPADGWQRQTSGLWRLSLSRKGHYRFFNNGQPVPEQRFPGQDWAAADLAVDHWAAAHGAVLFQLGPDQTPFDQTWTYAAAETGISLVDVRHVRIMNLEVVGYRTDGVNADNACRDVLLERVNSRDNGRAGIAVGGSSRVTAIDCQSLSNGRDSVLITERGGIDLENCNLGGIEPTVVP